MDGSPFNGRRFRRWRGALMRIRRRKEFCGARRLALLTDALLLGIDRRLRQLTLRGEDRPAKITGQRRSELRHVFGNARIVSWKRG